jgi:predicted nucleic acid-binding protein
MASAGELGPRRVDLALSDLLALRLERVPHGALLRRCWDLRANMSIYDAAYVALAEALATTLLTADGQLAAGPGVRCSIEVLT